MTRGSFVLSSLIAKSAVIALALGLGPACSTSDSGGDGSNTGGKSSNTGGKSSSNTGGKTATGGATAATGGSNSGGASGGGSGGSSTGGANPADGSTSDSNPATGGNDASSGTDTGGGGGGWSSNGCAGDTCLNKECKPFATAAPIGNFPEIEFNEVNYIPEDVVIPTFDDVTDRPYTQADGDKFTNFQDGDWTRKMLDWFDSKNLHMDFFMNGNNFCDVANNPGCQEVIKRILTKHNVGNHTVHHIHMGSKGPGGGTPDTQGCGVTGAMYKCEDEIS